MTIKTSIYEELGKKIAEEAMDGYIYEGKTLREWINILAQTQWIPVSEKKPESEVNGIMRLKSSLIPTLEKLKQEDYELWIQTQGKSHLSEEQWNWLIKTVKERSKNESTKKVINLADKEANKEVKSEV